LIRLLFILILVVGMVACSSAPRKGTIGQLRRVDIAIEKENIDQGFDKAIESYERFLEKTEKTAMTPEAIRRLADLKVEKEYGLITESSSDSAKSDLARPKKSTKKTSAKTTKKDIDSPGRSAPRKKQRATPDVTSALAYRKGETDTNFEDRSTSSIPPDTASTVDELPAEFNLERTGAKEAVDLYRKLLTEYPEYERSDQALYQLSRALEEQGQVEESMLVMERLVAAFPDSKYLDEVEFRRGESFFARRNYPAAEKAYESVVAIGEKSQFYVLALFKLGWSYYKQDLYNKALHKFIALLDYKAASGYDFGRISDDQEGKRIRDTLRIASQSFSNLGGVTAIIDYFSGYGRRKYEHVVYASLGEYYFSKQRYNDAVTTYSTFVSRNRTHRQAPLFDLRVIAINKAGGFASLVIEAKKEYVNRYGFGADYWKQFKPDYRPEVLDGLKVTLFDLANHYHARYQNKLKTKEKPNNLKEALHWYREFLGSFPMVDESAAMNYQLAELLLENKMYHEAAHEFEKTAYVYPVFAKAEKAAYASVYAFREHLKQVKGDDREQAVRDVIRVSLKFAESYPQNKKAAAVLAAAVDELYALKDYKSALIAARNLIERFPSIPKDVRRSALLVAAHSSFELELYADAEKAYTDVLKLVPESDALHDTLTDNLVASIYKQGEAANRSQNYKQAAEHFLRVARVAPASKLRPTADFDAAVALIKVEEWPIAASILTDFRKRFPKHKLQPEVTKKLAYIYREEGDFAKAAAEFLRIDAETTEPELRREALLTAADLYRKVDDLATARQVYRRYIEMFPEPVDVNIEARDNLATILKEQGEQKLYLDELQNLVDLEAAAGEYQTLKTREIAGLAALILARVDYEKSVAVRLVEPFAKNLQRKQALVKRVTEAYTKLFDYEIGVVTAEATFYLAETYADFSRSLMNSERPDGLSPLESEQYELALEEQAFPFEEKAIEMHQANIELISRGIYNEWIENSLDKLAVFMPARYEKPEMENNKFASMQGFRFENKELYRIKQAEAARAAEAKNSRMSESGQSKRSDGVDQTPASTGGRTD